MRELEELLTAISGGTGKIGTNEARMNVAASFGYIDARTMVFFLETYGLPLSMTAMEAAKRGLKVDFGGLRCELERIGKKPATIDSELAEIRYFVKTSEELAPSPKERA